MLGRKTLAALIICLAWSLTAAAPAAAQQSDEKFQQGQVGVLDVAKVRRTAKMAVDMDRQIGALRKKFSDEVKKKEDALRTEAEELDRQRVVLAPDAFKQRSEDLRKRAVEMQRGNQGLRKQLDTMRGEAVLAFQKSLNSTVFEHARKHNFVLILGRRELVFFQPALDITDEIIKQLDAKFPSYKLPDPTKEPAK